MFLVFSQQEERLCISCGSQNAPITTTRKNIRSNTNEILRKRSFFGTPNRYFDRQHGARLLNQYLDEKIYTDQELMNFDGIMLNEHHANPFCLGQHIGGKRF